MKSERCLYLLVSMLWITTSLAGRIISNKPANPKMKSTGQIIKRLRSLMQDVKYVTEPIHAYIVPSNDAHQSEYTCDHDKRRNFITGFTGSAGTAIVTSNEALLWTDGRYYLQASEQMDENWTLMKEGLATTPTQAVWLSKNLPAGARVGVDPSLMGYSKWKPLQSALEASGKYLVPIETNLVDEIWENRPSLSNASIKPLELKYSGKSCGDKLKDVHEQMKDKNANLLVLTALDEIAWLLNLRGADIDYNPVFFSYALVSLSKVCFFVDTNKVTEEIRHHFHNENLTVEIYPYEEVRNHLSKLVEENNNMTWISDDASFALTNLIPEKKRLSETTPVQLLKAIKNPTEVKGMANAHIRDGAALCCYFAWLEKEVPSGKVTEISGATKLEECRRMQKDFVGLSFTTISSSGPNGAIIHYSPTKETDRAITTSELYLCDSGAQYKDGTTDVTRTLHFGTPTDYEREQFTKVLKGQIAIRTAIFPNKVKGNTLDTLARKFLWDDGFDYAHGTGHGIGMFLNVHEGPMGISWRQLPNDPGLQENMFLSNEPGFYENGKFGIRIEDIVQIIPAKVRGNFGGKGALTFDTITLAPIQAKMIDISMLTDKEIDLLNTYHKQCLNVVGALLLEQKQQQAYEWLLKQTQPITRNNTAM